VFAGLPDPLEATRYHSLVVARAGLPDCFVVTAEAADGTIMGLRHRELPLEGVQFHPESILTTGGHDLLASFLGLALA
jgi:anthranilate/para-aminobenzoate synthase component II